MLVFAFLVGLLATSKAWILKASHTTVDIGKTVNVSLICEYGGSLDSKPLVSLERIRIYRKYDSGRKKTVAKVGLSTSSPKSDERQVTSKYEPGENFKESYLKVTWPVATEDTPGEYGCEIIGLLEDRGHAPKIVPTVTIKRKSLTLQDLLQMIEDSKRVFQEKQNSLEMEIKNLKKELANARNDNENARQNIIESTKQSISQLRNESEEGSLILLREVTRQREIDTVFRQDISELKKITKDMNTNLQEAISDFREDLSSSIMQVNLTFTAEYKNEISQLRRESEEADVTTKERILVLENETIGNVSKQIKTLESRFQRVVSNISDQTDELYKSLQEKILRITNETIHQITLQIRENEETYQKDISDIKKEYMELEENFQQQLLNLKNSTDQNTIEQNHETKRTFQEIFFKLENLTSYEAERRGLENFTKLKEDISDLKITSYDISQKLKDEVVLRQLEHVEINAKIVKTLSDLKNFTAQEISNESETFNQKLKQKVADVKFASQEKYEQIEQIISKLENKFKESNKNVSEEISELKNVTTEDASKECKEHIAILRQHMSDLKNHTANEIQGLRENIKERLMNANNETEAKIEKKAREASNRVQDDLTNLRNFTVMELMKQKETDIHLEQKYLLLRQDLKLKFVSKTDFTLKLSSLKNSTEVDKMEWEDQLSQFKNFTSRDIRTLVEKTDRERNKIYEKINNQSSECKMNVAELRSNLTDVRKDLRGIPNVLENGNNFTVNHVNNEMMRFRKLIERLIQSVDNKYENVTNALTTELAEKSQCICPTAQPPKPTIRISQLPTDTTLSSKVSEPPTKTTLNLSTTSETTETTTSPEAIWPEGTYAFMTPKTGCPTSKAFNWEEGWIQFHTETDYNKDKATDGFHFKGPLFRTDGIDNFLQIYYCLKKETVTNETYWPKGSYCVNRVNGQCPSGFKSGYIQYDEEHTHIQQRHKNAPDIKSVKGSLERVYYCCRRDGPADVAIHLPTEKPFYLYRAKDVPCQKVFGMNVAVEVLQIDTNHEENQDKVEDSDNHPYAFLHPVKHSLCYYSR